KRLAITTAWKAKQHYVWADPVRLEQVFWNLINNAVKFTGPGGAITIQTGNTGGNFKLEVIDTGIGIEPARQQTIFNAFDQGDRATGRQFGGLGLGLAICKNLVELHGGAITVNSPGRSFGTTATVT